MPASTTALTVIAAPSTPAGSSFDEQASDVSPGNNFANPDGNTLLYARNTTAGALDLIFEADVFGTERTVLQTSIPGSGTENGVKILGPFPPSKFNEHGTTEAASTGKVFVRQATGSDGQVVLCPFRVNTVLQQSP